MFSGAPQAPQLTLEPLAAAATCFPAHLHAPIASTCSTKSAWQRDSLGFWWLCLFWLPGCHLFCLLTAACTCTCVCQSWHHATAMARGPEASVEGTRSATVAVDTRGRPATALRKGDTALVGTALQLWPHDTSPMSMQPVHNTIARP